MGHPALLRNIERFGTAYVQVQAATNLFTTSTSPGDLILAGIVPARRKSLVPQPRRRKGLRSANSGHNTARRYRDSASEGQLLDDLDGDGKPRMDRQIFSWNRLTPCRMESDAESEETASSERENPKAEKKGDQPPQRHRVKATTPVGEKRQRHGIATVRCSTGDRRTDVLVWQRLVRNNRRKPMGRPVNYHADWNLHATSADDRHDLDRDAIAI